MMTLRLIVPPDRAGRVTAQLVDDDRTTNLVVVRGGGIRPAGHLVPCEVTREAVSDVLGWLRREGLDDDGSVVLSEVTAAPSANARATEAAAPGAPDDAIVWDAVLDSAYGEVRGSWSLYAFLTLATAIAALVGVFISVTTVPAAGDIALSLAVGAPGHLLGAASQPGIDLLGITIAGVVTLTAQRTLWSAGSRRRSASDS